MSNIGYVVVARRSKQIGQIVSSIWPDPGPCENHVDYCTGMAERRGDHDVEYVVASLTLPDPPGVLSDQITKVLREHSCVHKSGQCLCGWPGIAGTDVLETHLHHVVSALEATIRGADTMKNIAGEQH